MSLKLIIPAERQIDVIAQSSLILREELLRFSCAFFEGDQRDPVHQTVIHRGCKLVSGTIA